MWRSSPRNPPHAFWQAGQINDENELNMPHPIQLQNRIAQHLAVVRRCVSASEFSRVIPEACGLVWNELRRQQIAGAGCHVAVYFDDQINLEVGVEIEKPFEGSGDVVRSATPAGLVAATTHFGPYSRLHEAHDAIHKWCANHGYVLAGPRWERYGHWQESWNRDPSQIRTEVVYLLRQSGESV
jgi:effector-binding domain-containing protein